MPIVIHDTLTTAPFLLPVTLNWVELPLPVEGRAQLRGGDLSPEDVALIPAAEMAWLQESHLVVPDVALVATGEGAISMRVPVRPDEIDSTPVRLYDASGTAEILGRATLQPFYGITATAWTNDDSADAQVVIVEGAEALREPEAGLAEDLVRAWFILTAQPVVSHVLVAPKSLDRAALAPALAAFDTLRATAHERRRDLRRELAEREGIDRDRLTRVYAAQRLSLEPEDRRALLMLLQRGNRGSTYPYVWDLAFLEPDSTGEP
ncbi:MAG: chorismate dehydratase [Thermomicrobiales bacterium]|jgi:predicted solute-binding protein|nr:chorismate dehydratase [Thermomicrobiales bacterium]